MTDRRLPDSARVHTTRPAARIAIGLLGLSLIAAGVRADHVDDGAYPYVAEVTVELTAQEKFYLVDPKNPLLFREATTTRLAGYRFWGSGLVGTQNEPEDGGPHGPLKNLGLLVHEMGQNRDGVSTLELFEKDAKTHIRLTQDTVLVHKDGTRTPDLKFSVEVPIAVANGSLASFSERTRLTAQLTQAGTDQFEGELKALVERVLNTRRAEMETSLAENGLGIIKGTEHYEVTFPGKRGMRMVFDTQLGAARLRLPDMRLFMTSNMEQTYEESGTSNER